MTKEQLTERSAEYERRMGLPLLPPRYNYSSPSLRYLDRARLFPEDLDGPREGAER